MGYLEINEPTVGVPVGKPLADVLLDRALIILSPLEPPEPFRPGGHVLDHGLVGKVFVPVDNDLADGDPFALFDIEDHARAPGTGCQLQNVDLGGVVALMLVQRVDGSSRLLYRIPVEWAAFVQSHPALDLAFAEPLHTAYRPFLQHRTLLDPDDQHQPLAHVPLFHDHVVELTGPKERGNGPLNVPVIDWLVNDDPGAAADLRGGEALITLHKDTVDGRRGRVLGREDRLPSQQEPAGSEGR